MIEREGTLQANGTVGLAQFMGALAPNEQAGDENLRLGFTVHGDLNQRGDFDL